MTGVFYSPGDVPNVVFIPSELNGEKNGADDFIVRHGADAFARLMRLARPAWIWKGGKDPKRIFWTPEADNAHFIAQAFIAVLQERYAIHPTRDTLIQRQALGAGAGETSTARPTPPADG